MNIAVKSEVTRTGQIKDDCMEKRDAIAFLNGGGIRLGTSEEQFQLK